MKSSVCRSRPFDHSKSTKDQTLWDPSVDENTDGDWKRLTSSCYSNPRFCQLIQKGYALPISNRLVGREPSEEVICFMAG